jgi:hypothetical protein
MNMASVINYVNYFPFYGRQSSWLPPNVKSVPCPSDFVEEFQIIFKPIICLLRYTLYLQKWKPYKLKTCIYLLFFKSYLCLYIVVFSLGTCSTCNNSFKYCFINLCSNDNVDNSCKTNYNKCVTFGISCVLALCSQFYYLWCNSVVWVSWIILSS